VDPKPEKSELVWIPNRKNGANGASGAFHHRAKPARWAIAADPEAHSFWPEPAAARQDARHERADTLRNKNNHFLKPFFYATFFNGQPAEAPRADLDGGFDRSMPHALG